MTVFQLPVLNTNRQYECGECTACCVNFPLLPEPHFWPEGKRACEPCRFLGKGCTIHDQPRPKVCTDFKCSWLRGLLGSSAADWRPDKSGLLITLGALDDLLQGYFSQAQMDGKLPPHWSDDDPGWGIVETRPEALVNTDRHSLAYRLDKAKFACRMVVVIPYGRDPIYDERKGMRQSSSSSFAVWWSDTPDYADKLIEWWEGAEVRVAG